MAQAKVTSKGQITVPAEVRERLGIVTGDLLEFVPDGSSYRLTKRIARSRIDRWVGCLQRLRGKDVDGLIERLRGR